MVINIALPKEDDRRLEAVAPEYLQGGGKATARIRWAIAEHIARLDPDGRLCAAKPEETPKQAEDTDCAS